MALFGFLAVLLWVGPLLDCASIFLVLPKITWPSVIAIFISGFYVNVSQAICTALCLLPLGLELWTEYRFQKARETL